MSNVSKAVTQWANKNIADIKAADAVSNYTIQSNRERAAKAASDEKAASEKQTSASKAAAEKLTGVQDREARSLATAMAMLGCRARCMNTEALGPYLVKTSFPLSRDDLENYLRSLS